MTDFVADDFAAIRARWKEIAREEAKLPVGFNTMTRTELEALATNLQLPLLQGETDAYLRQRLVGIIQSRAGT